MHVHSPSITHSSTTWLSSLVMTPCIGDTNRAGDDLFLAAVIFFCCGGGEIGTAPVSCEISCVTTSPSFLIMLIWEMGRSGVRLVCVCVWCKSRIAKKTQPTSNIHLRNFTPSYDCKGSNKTFTKNATENISLLYKISWSLLKSQQKIVILNANKQWVTLIYYLNRKEACAHLVWYHWRSITLLLHLL